MAPISSRITKIILSFVNIPTFRQIMLVHAHSMIEFTRKKKNVHIGMVVANFLTILTDDKDGRMDINRPVQSSVKGWHKY